VFDPGQTNGYATRKGINQKTVEWIWADLGIRVTSRQPGKRRLWFQDI